MLQSPIRVFTHINSADVCLCVQCVASKHTNVCSVRAREKENTFVNEKTRTTTRTYVLVWLTPPPYTIYVCMMGECVRRVSMCTMCLRPTVFSMTATAAAAAQPRRNIEIPMWGALDKSNCVYVCVCVCWNHTLFSVCCLRRLRWGVLVAFRWGFVVFFFVVVDMLALLLGAPLDMRYFRRVHNDDMCCLRLIDYVWGGLAERDQQQQQQRAKRTEKSSRRRRRRRTETRTQIGCPKGARQTHSRRWQRTRRRRQRRRRRDRHETTHTIINGENKNTHAHNVGRARDRKYAIHGAPQFSVVLVPRLVVPSDMYDADHGLSVEFARGIPAPDTRTLIWGSGWVLVSGLQHRFGSESAAALGANTIRTRCDYFTN